MLLLLVCSPDAHSATLKLSPITSQFATGEVETHSAGAIPTRKELKFLEGVAQRFVSGSTPSLDEIAAQPDVKHQGAPVADPHPVREPVRILVYGGAAALAAVVTKLMRIDALWVEVAFVPTEPSDVGTVWGISADTPFEELARFAVLAPAQPTALIRDDHGLVVLGAATIAGPDGETMVGEVIVDSETLYHFDGAGKNKAGQDRFNNGVRFSPTLSAPGLAAVQQKPLEPQGWWKKLRARSAEASLQPTLLSGRALQAGGMDLMVTRDDVAHPRPLKSVTFYRHLRDGQFVRQ